MRLIDADKELEHIKKRLLETALNNDRVVCDAAYLYADISDNRIETWINEAPTVDVEPVKHAKWVIEPDRTVMHCNACGWAFEYYDYAWIEKEWNYCPHCGARMDGEEHGR